MNNEFLKARSTQYAAYATVYIGIVVAILGAINFLAQRYNKSVDTTSSKKFSLSDQTNKVVRELKAPVTISYFDKSDNFRTAHDLLDRYTNLSSKLTVNYIDPDKKPTIAKSMGLRNYGAIILDSGSKRDEAKSLTEDEVTSAIVRLFKGGNRVVCYVSGSGEHPMDNAQERTGYGTLKATIERDNYKTQSISLLDKAEIPKTCTVTVVGGPRLDYIPAAVTAIKNHIETGGRVLFLLSPPLAMGREEIAENAGLAGLLQSYGVTANKDLILDTSSIGQLVGLNEVSPVATAYEQHPITKSMEGITAFPYARSLDIKNGDKTTVSKLFSTSPNSYATTNLSSAEIKIDPKKDKQGPFTLAAAGVYNTGKSDNEGRFIVVGSADWTDNFIFGARVVANRDLLLNMVNWLSSDEDLISIRPKEPENRPLIMTQRGMSAIALVSLILFPLMAVLSGVSVWWRRR